LNKSIPRLVTYQQQTNVSWLEKISRSFFLPLYHNLYQYVRFPESCRSGQWFTRRDTFYLPPAPGGPGRVVLRIKNHATTATLLKPKPKKNTYTNTFKETLFLYPY
jgi:hypothetical protein